MTNSPAGHVDTFNPFFAYGDPSDLADRIAKVKPKMPPHVLGSGTATVYVLPPNMPLHARRLALRAGRLARHHQGRNHRRALKWANSFRRRGGSILHEKDFGGGDGLRAHMESTGDIYAMTRGSDYKAALAQKR